MVEIDEEGDGQMLISKSEIYTESVGFEDGKKERERDCWFWVGL